MVTKILTILSMFIISVMTRLGYLGIVLLMAIESACIPLPSEIIMPFSGYLVWSGVFNLWLVALMGALGNVLGSLVAYFAGMWGGRLFVEKYGKYILISHHDLDMADAWFSRHGDITVFTARMLPIIRTFIAFPAGVSKMKLLPFILYTFTGSYTWCLMLALIGKHLGQHWSYIKVYFHKFDLLIGLIIVAGLAWYIKRHIDSFKRGRSGARA